jgi:hypothetical protein
MVLGVWKGDKEGGRVRYRVKGMPEKAVRGVS